MPTYQKIYKDLDLDFTPHPVTGDIVQVKDSNSVKRGIKNILLTENQERLFQPEIGSGLKNLLPLNIVLSGENIIFVPDLIFFSPIF